MPRRKRNNKPEQTAPKAAAVACACSCVTHTPKTIKEWPINRWTTRVKEYYHVQELLKLFTTIKGISEYFEWLFKAWVALKGFEVLSAIAPPLIEAIKVYLQR